MPTLQDVADIGNLTIAHACAKRGKGKQYWVKRVDKHKERYLNQLRDNLLSGEYRTSRYRNKVIIDSRKERTISRLPYYPDRIVHWAILYQLEPYFIASFSERTHAAIPNRGIHKALKQTREIIKNHPELKYCLKFDIRHYFQSVDHEVLKRELYKCPIDNGLYNLLCGIVDSFPRGIPIGNYTSQYFANYYLNTFDEYIEGLGLEHVRYMDDVIVFGESSKLLHNAKNCIEHYLNLYMHLGIKPNWQIFPIASRGIDFVGYRVFANRVLLRKTTFRSMRRKLTNVYNRVKSGVWTEHDRSVVASYAGWCKYCTPKVRHGLYDRYFYPILHSLPAGYDKFEKNIRELMI